MAIKLNAFIYPNQSVRGDYLILQYTLVRQNIKSPRLVPRINSTSMDSLTRTIAILMVGLILSGLGSYGYSFKNKKAQTYTIITMYTLTVIILYCVFYIGDIIRDFNSENFALDNIGKLNSFLNIIGGIVSYITYLVYAQRQISFLNNGYVIFYEILYYLDDGQAYARQITQVCIKALIFPALFEMTLVVRSLHFEPDRSVLWTLYALLPYVIRTAPATSVYGATLLSTALMQSINSRVQLIADEVNQIRTHKEWLLKTPYHRMQRYCDLSDEVELLNGKYTDVIELTNELLDYSALPWLSSILCNVTGIMLGFYTQYKSTADTLFNGKEFDFYNVITNSVFWLISFLEIYTQAKACSANVEEVRRTGVILQRADLIGADIRLIQSMEFFSLRILQRDYKAKPLGLFEVDLSLVHGVFSTVIGFLLILIQSDLSRRFLQ